MALARSSSVQGNASMCSAKVRPTNKQTNNFIYNSVNLKIDFCKIFLATSELFRFLDDQSRENIFVILLQSVILHGPQR